MSRDRTQQAAAVYLDWWQAAGVTDAVSEAAADWFAPPPAIAARRQMTAQARSEPQSAPTPALQPAAKPAAAAFAVKPVAAHSLDELQSQLQAYEGCGLKVTAKSLCFYRGVPQARLMLIGEAPGREEDLAGKPFVGRAGQLLDRMLAAIGIDEGNAHITNTVYWRPPGNRTPTPEETLACAPFLARQMELVNPDVIVLLGGVAAKSMLGVADGILKLRGKWRSLNVGGREVRTLATLHPAYLLRTPAAKRQAWQDLLMVEKALQG